jgi:hypothetical protein
MKHRNDYTKSKTIDVYECKSCEIDSLTGNRMCPCPRGSCDAVIVGKLQTIRTYERTAHYGEIEK